MNSGRSVLVIGAAGVLGSTVAAAFTESGWEVERGVRRPDGTPGSVLLDLDRPDTVAAAIDGVDLVVNTVPHEDFVPENLVLQRGGRLLNVVTIDWAQDRRLRKAAWTNPRGTVVLNAGLAPGVTNLVAADLIASYPNADTIEIALSLSTKGMSGPAGVKFAHRNITASGRHGSYSGRHATAVIPLPPPIGERRCFGFAERERGWVGNLASGRTVRSYAYFDQPALHAGILTLNPLRVLSGLPVRPFLIGHRTPPATPTREPVMHWVSVLHNGTRLASRTVQCRGDYLHAAFAAAIMGETLLGPTAFGCFNPEELFTLPQLRNSLDHVGITIEQSDAVAAG